MSTKTIVFQHTLDPGKGVELEEKLGMAGTIRQITFHFPPGCNSLVGIAFSINHVQICPASGYISLDSATPQYIANEPVVIGAKLKCMMVNYDKINSHTPSATITVEDNNG